MTRAMDVFSYQASGRQFSVFSFLLSAFGFDLAVDSEIAPTM